MIAFLRAWLFKDMLDELEAEHTRVTTERQQEAYRLGHETGWAKGLAVGELMGQNMLAESLHRVVDERHSLNPDPTHADIDRAKKGILH